MAFATMVQNFNLPGEIHNKFALDWSADNKIAMCTAKAIYILTSHSSPVESGFPSPLHKQIILEPKEPMILKELWIPPNPYKYVKSVEDKDNLHNVLMDRTINPKPPDRAELFRSFRSCKWSPKGAAKDGRCLLAALTMDHRLIIYEEIGKEWKSICDLTEILKEENIREKRESTFIPEESEDTTSVRKRKRKSKEIKLSKRLSKSKRKFEDASDEDNDVQKDEKIEIDSHKRKRKSKEIKLSKQLLKSKRKCEDASDKDYDVQKDEDFEVDSRNLGDFDISKKLNHKKLMAEVYKMAPMEIIWTGMFRTSDSYEYCYLIVAMKSGHIQFWRVSPYERERDGRVVTVAYEWDTGLGLLSSMCWQQTSPSGGFIMCGSTKGVLAFLPVSIRFDENQAPNVILKQMCKVWDEEDYLAIDHISVLKIALKKYVIIAAKMHALVGCEIIQLDSSIVIKNRGHSYGLHRLPVHGMAVLDSTMPQYRVLISTMEGLIIEIKVSLGNDEIKFLHEKIPVDLDLRNNSIKGLAVSTNGLLCALILSTSSYYDHLEKKEPLQFAMFVTRPFEDIYTKLKTVLKPQFSFLPSSNCTISRQTDYLEIIRINLSCGTPLPEWLTAFIDNDPSTYENCSSLELYMMRFILHSYVSGLATSVPQGKENLEAKLCAVEAIIMRNYISKVFESSQDKVDLLSPAQGQSLLLMADWLFKEFQMPVESLYLALGSEIPTDVESLPARETCRICKADVKLENIKTGQCVNNHSFARCCQSLLLCDVIPYHQCLSCKSIALRDVWSFGFTCTYCGMSMT